MRMIPETHRRWPLALFCLLSASFAAAQSGNPVNLQIHADQITAHMPPTFHGLMTEEINYAFEGGLYAELIRNRNFKETVPARTNRQNPDQSTPAKEAKDLVHWSLVQERGGAGSMALDATAPLNAAVPATLKLAVSEASGNQSVGIANDGFWGIPVKPNSTYKAMFYAKAAAGFTGGITASIVSNDGATVAATAQVPKLTEGWQKYQLTLTTGEFAMLKALVRHPRQPLSREKLAQLARGREFEPFDRSLDMHVSRFVPLLREKEKPVWELAFSAVCTWLSECWGPDMVSRFDPWV